MKCLEKSPARRYSTAQALADDLGRFLEGQPIHARPTGAWERGWKWARRRPAIASLAASIVAVVVVAFALVTRQWLRADAEADARAREAQRAAAAESIALERAYRESLAHEKSARGEAALALDRGIEMCRRGEVGPGLHLFLRCLEAAPADAVDLRQAALHNFAAWQSSLTRQLKLRLEHGGPITSAALQPNGSTIATAGKDGNVRIWSTQDGRLIHCLQHAGPVHAIAFSGDSEFLVAAVEHATGESGEAVLYRVSADKVEKVEPICSHPTPVMCVAISKSGNEIVTAGKDEKVRFWRKGMDREVHIRNVDGPISSIALAPNGNLALVGRQLLAKTKTGVIIQKQSAVEYWNTESNNQNGWLGTSGLSQALAFAADSKTFLTDNGGPRARFNAGVILKVAKRPDDEKFAIHNPVAITAVAFGPDDAVYITGGIDGMVRLWERRHEGPTLFGVHLWDRPADQPSLLGMPIAHPSPIRALGWSGNADHLMVACADGNVFLWAYSALVQQGAAMIDRRLDPILLPASFSPIATYLPNGKQILAAYFGEVLNKKKEWGKAGLWDVDNRNRTGTPCPAQRQFSAMAVHPDGTQAVFANASGATPRLISWDLKSASSDERNPEQKNRIYALAWGRDADGNDCVASASWDGSVALIDPVTWTVRDHLRHTSEVYSVAFRPDGRLLATGAADGEIRLWDPLTLEAIKPPSPLKHSSGPVLCLEFTPNGQMLVSGAADRTICRWEIPGGRLLGEPLNHGAAVRALAISPDGELIASITGGWQGIATDAASVYLWSAALGKAIGAPHALEGPIRTVSFHPDGRTLLIAAGGAARPGFSEIGSSVPRFEFLGLPPRLPDDLSLLRKRVEIMTGFEVTTPGRFRALPVAKWKEQRDELIRMGLLE